MQSHDYVPGVSGWKFDPDTGAFELCSSRVTVLGVDPRATYSGKSPEEARKPFIVVDGVTYISQAFIRDSSISKTTVGDNWSVKVEDWHDGRKYFAGIGAGVELPFIVKADRFAINGRDASEILDMIAGKIRETELGVGLKGAIADQVREVIRAECKPGGILYRSR
ncbi:DUF1983 domain-containing protein [Pseudomonas protegens]|uniref:phage tail tip fiber protein n=1 Tax=Pseudomonas protegens TaxID=380021 RepID=UPI00381D11E8